MSNWVMTARTSVFSTLKGMLMSEFKSEYPKLNVTRKKSDDIAEFPTVFITFLDASEKGKDLQGINLNATDIQIQYEIYTNKDQGLSLADEIGGFMVDSLKSLGFAISMMPTPQSYLNDVTFYVGRASRLLCVNDKL